MEKRKIVFYLTIGMILILHLTACTNRSSELPAPDSTVFGYEGETKIIFDGVCAKYNDKKEKIYDEIKIDNIYELIENMEEISDIRKNFYKKIIEIRYEILKEVYEKIVN